MCGCLWHAPYWGPGLQPRHVPWLGIQPATHWFVYPHSMHWATPGRAPSRVKSFKEILFIVKFRKQSIYYQPLSIPESVLIALQSQNRTHSQGLHETCCKPVDPPLLANICDDKYFSFKNVFSLSLQIEYKWPAWANTCWWFL